MHAVLIVLIIRSLPTPAAAQAGRAELFGVIRDASGLPVPGTVIQAKDQATMARYSGTSDDRGEYHLVGLPASNYVVTVEQPGFRVYRQSGITLRLAERTALDIQLQIGENSQTVEVTAAAPVLQTASGEVSMNVDEKKVTTLPLDGRNFIPLVTMAQALLFPAVDRCYRESMAAGLGQTSTCTTASAFCSLNRDRSSTIPSSTGLPSSS